MVCLLMAGLSAVCVARSVWAQEAATAPSQEATQALQLLQSADPYQRKLGFLRLEALREPATVPAIRQYVESPDADMRADSLRALAAIDGEASIPLLLEKLRSDRRPSVRWSALLGLEPLTKHHPELILPFIDALRDYSSEVRMAAVDVVSRLDDPRARAAVRDRFRRELRPDVRRVLHAAMRRIGTAP